MDEKPEKDNNEKRLDEFKKRRDTDNTLSSKGKIALNGLTNFFQNLSERIKEDDNPDNAFEYITDSFTTAVYGDQLPQEAGPTGTLCRYCDNRAMKLNICCKCKTKLCSKHSQICHDCIGIKCKYEDIDDDDIHKNGSCQEITRPTVDCAQQ